MQSDNNTDIGFVNPDTGFCYQGDRPWCAAAAGAMLLYYAGVIVSMFDMFKLMGSNLEGDTDIQVLDGLRAALVIHRSPYRIEPIWNFDINIRGTMKDQAYQLLETKPDGSGHSVVIFTEPDRGGVILKNPAKMTGDGLVPLSKISEDYTPHIAFRLYKP